VLAGAEFQILPAAPMKHPTQTGQARSYPLKDKVFACRRELESLKGFGEGSFRPIAIVIL